MRSPDDLDLIVDEPVRNLVRALNEIPDIQTLQSCGGHVERGTEGQYWVQFAAMTWPALDLVASIMGYNSQQLMVEVMGWDADEEENEDPNDWSCAFQILGGSEVTPDAVAARLRRRLQQREMLLSK